MKRGIYVLVALFALFIATVLTTRDNEISIENDSVKEDAMQRIQDVHALEPDPELPQPASDEFSGTTEAPFGKSDNILDRLHSMDYWRLVDSHWQKAVDGEGDSMVAVHSAMRICSIYKSRFAGKDIAEVHAEYAVNNDPSLIALNEAIWLNCGPLYDNWGSYEGWEDMIGEAADVSHPYAMMIKAKALVVKPDDFEEALVLIESALTTGDVLAVAELAGIYHAKQPDPALAYAWVLAACDLGLDCTATGAYMQSTCGPFSSECGINESVEDFMLRELGDYSFDKARSKARMIVSSIESGDIERLRLREELH